MWRLAVTATDGGWRPQEKDKLSDKRAVRYRASAGRQALEREEGGGGGRKVRRWEQKRKTSQEGTGNR